ncbi:hypothetical protein A4H97_09875 [Niastella yeongjuensis]|uniref:Ricin B lectin domain-containing protein n=1 Tax=Niastella yeongjuensis TaxID=354355 RepID=A0A1V9EF34_9BACT|nr:RICIN domain-containing protein [Niastella yeongjuensis]OQP44661.1 hypothetical protein A4H97_09875 [Niastella yeongjuensis]SEO79476.1 Ricin-type beta-trefoil lectin domain-like [Niastella yeongjuensis]
MRKRKLLVLIAVGILWHLNLKAQTILGLESYFEEAYWRYPNVPRGLLEATAYAASHFKNLQPSPSDVDNSAGKPQRYGLFALIANNNGHYKNNLQLVCNSSGITPDQYNKDVRLQILSVAKFLSREASFKQLDGRISAEGFAEMLNKLAAVPDDSTDNSHYALALFKYEIYDQLQKGINTPSLKRAPVNVQMDQLFPAPLLQQLQSEKHTADVERGINFITIENGVYRITNVNSNKVMNTRDCSGKSLAVVTQGTWAGKACQRWRFEYAGDGWYKITSLVSGRALEVPGGSKDNVQLLLKTAKENDNQLWRLLEAGSNKELRLVNKASEKVVDVFAGSANNGAAVLQTAWTGKNRQKWLLTAENESAGDEANRFRKVQW